MTAARRTFRTGFTLLELSVVMVIISLVASLGISLSRNINTGSDRITTQQRLATIQSALEAYVTQYGYLPCPASRANIPTDDAFGTEQRIANPGAYPAARCDATTSPALRFINGGTAATSIYIGAVPTQTLGIPANYAGDAWGNKFLYAVSYNHVVGQDSSGNNTYFVQDGPITVRFGDRTNYYAITTDRNGNPGAGATYVVLSHGANGLGGYALNSTSRWALVACPTIGSACTPGGGDCGQIDIENCDDSNSIFYDTEFNDGATGPSSFDDYIVWGSNKLSHAPIPQATGQAQAGSTSSITLANTASASNAAYGGATITITGGTGSGQSAPVTAYNGASKVASTSWLTAPDATSTYSVSTPTAQYGSGCAPGVCETWCAPCFNQPTYTPDPSAGSSAMQIYVCQATISSAAPNCQAKCVYGYIGVAVGSATPYNIPCQW